LTSALTMLRGLVFRYSASSGTGAWLGTPTGPQRSVIAWSSTSASRSFFDRAGCAQFVQFAVGRAVLGWNVGEQRHEHERAAGHPPAPPRVLAREARPAEHARAAEHAQDRRREERVAGVDRQPGRGECGEHDDREHAGNGAEQRPPRSHHSDSTPPRAAPTSTGGRRISPIRRGCTRGTLPMPVTRSSVSAVWRVFVSDHSGCR
jgi:hypothetical protein